MSFKSKFLAFICALLAANAATALQVIEPTEGRNERVTISAKETTRLTIEDGKIRSLIATDGELTVEKDEERGQLFIRPVILDKPINIRLISSNGATYSIILQAVDVPQEDILIREPHGVRAGHGPDYTKTPAGTLSKTVRSLITAMALDKPPSHIDYRPTEQEFTLWDKTRFVLTGVFTERDLVGEKYRLTNTGTDVIRLVEQELYRKGVVAVSIENMELTAGQSTNIYVVRSN